MKIIGTYMDKNWASLDMNYSARIALEVNAAWTVSYSGRDDETRFFVIVRSGCYMFHITAKDNEYISKERADRLVDKIALNGIVDLDNENMGLFVAVDTTPEEYFVRNAFDENYEEIPLSVASV